MNFIENSFLYVVISTLLLSVLIYRFAMKDNKPHCDNFVVNVYLYIALSFSLIGLFIHVINAFFYNRDTKLIPINQTFLFRSMYIFILYLVISFGSLILLSMQDIFSKEGFLLNHALWIIFISTLSLSTFPFFKSIEFSEYIGNAIYMTSVVFFLMSLMVYIFPGFFEKTYKIAIIALLIALITIILIEVFVSYTRNSKFNRVMYYAVLVVFSLLVSYDTSRMFQYAKQCVDSPNYPKISTRQTLNIINLFQNFLIRRR